MGHGTVPKQAQKQHNLPVKLRLLLLSMAYSVQFLPFHFFVTMRLLFLIVALLLPTRVWALQPEINWSVFYVPNQGGVYVENYVLIPSSSVRFVGNGNGMKQAKVEITTTFTQHNTLVKFDRYVLNSVAVADSLPPQFNLLDQKRTLLLDGDYRWQMQFKDLNDTANTAVFERDLHLQQPSPNGIAISDLLLVEKYTPTQAENDYSRNGYDLVPNVIHYFSADLTRLGFYAEIYNTDTTPYDTEFLAKYYIAQQGAVQPVGKWQSFKKMKPAAVNVVFADFDINDLYSGNYEVVLEVRNRDNEILSTQRTLFQRNKKNPQKETGTTTSSALISGINFQNADVHNTFVSAFTVKDAEYHLRSIMPLIAQASEQRVIANLHRAADLSYMQRYLYRFWERISPNNPKTAFDKYQSDLNLVEQQYGTPFSKGFETEFGRVYLRYGKPNDVLQVGNDPVAFPYQIWHYYQLDAQQKDIRFVFYQPDESGDYRLIHSDAQDEPYEPNWKRWVFNRARQSNNNDASNNQRTEELDYFGNKGREADEYFRKNNKFDSDGAEPK